MGILESRVAKRSVLITPHQPTGTRVQVEAFTNVA